jgi:hypothetical protein
VARGTPHGCPLNGVQVHHELKYKGKKNITKTEWMRRKLGIHTAPNQIEEQFHIE